jgi:peptidyl-prolyl cis-trans isomerase A (cyclophilin A)
MLLKRSTLQILALVSITILGGCKKIKNPIINMETELGTIKIELYKEQAPISVANFLNYVNKAMLNGGEFYRVVTKHNQPNDSIKIEVIQGGMGWDDSVPRLAAIAHETTQQTRIRHKTGIISMARAKPGSASSEFFICMDDEPELDFGGNRNPDGQGFAAFGKVVQGFEIAQQIQNLPAKKQMLITPVKIINVKIQ